MTPPRVAVAPGFRLPGAWEGRLLVGEPWRVPTAEERAALVLGGPGGDLGDCLYLFQIPAHLRAAFWAMLERDGELRPDEAKRFFPDVARFLDYKQFSAPAGAVFEVVA
ncbi:MAG: hypothetical protein ACRC33_17600, partial [Gemmataceae bacterium]